MAYGRTNYARNDQVRLHLFMDGVGMASPDPIYWPCMGVDALQHDLGDITPVEIPDPDRYGEYVIVDGIPGQKGRVTTSLTTRKIIGEESPLAQLERRGAQCGIDVMLTRGICDVPTDYNQFAELMIWEDMKVTSYSTSALAALSSDQRESTTESVDVSIGMAYTIYNMLYGLVASPSEASAVPAGIVIAPSWCCGSGECAIMFVASADNLYFCTKGTCTTTAYAGGDIDGLTIVGNRLIVARGGAGLDVVLFDKNGIVNTNAVAISGIGAAVDAVDSNGRYGLFSSGLKLYKFNATATSVDSTDVTSIAGAAASKLADVSVSPDGVGVAISDKAYPMYSTDGIEWTQGTVIPGTTPVGTAICAMSDESWVAGTGGGDLFLTSDSGVTWTKVLDATGAVNDIKRVTKNVAYAAIGSTLYRSVDGGATWNLEPNVVGRSFVSVTSVNKLAPCADNPNSIAMAVVTGSALRVVTGRPG